MVDKTKEFEYIDKDRGILKQYQSPEMFLRHIENAYLGIFNINITEIAEDTPDKECYMVGLRKRIFKNNFSMNMYYCCKVFATYLRNKGIELEVMDLLQGIFKVPFL